LEEDVIWSEEAYHSLSQTYKQIPGMRNLMEQMLATTELCNESLEVTWIGEVKVKGSKKFTHITAFSS
jgi:hypothetical protein